MRRPVARHLLALGLYALAAVILTSPLVLHFSTHVPGDGIDDPALAWNLWWIKARLVDQLDARIFSVDYMFHPIGVNLAFYTLTPLNGLVSVPLQLGLQLVVANNLVLLSSFVLGGYGTFLLALYLQSRYLSVNGTAGKADDSNRYVITTIALFAGTAYAFASSKLFYAALGQFNIASSQWIPFAALYVLRIGESQSTRAAVRNGVLAGLFFTLQAWAELTYASFLLIFFCLYAVWWVIVRLTWRGKDADGSRWHIFFSGVAVSACVFLLGVAPFLAAMLPDLLAEGDFFGSGGGFADVFSADLLGYLGPTRLHPLFGDFAAALPFPNDKGQHIYIGYVLTVLGAMGVVGVGMRGKAMRTRRHEGNLIWFWLLCAVVFFLLTLGPQVRWAGKELPIAGPFSLVSRLPFFSGNRYPSRYSVMLLLSASMLSVYGLRVIAATSFRRVVGRVSGREIPRRAFAGIAVALGALMLFEHLSIPLPMSDFRIPAVYERLASEPGDFTILELPTGWRNGARVMGRSDVLIMMQQWYQTRHGKRRLGGNTSRNPPQKFQYFTEAPLIGELIALMNADRDHIAAFVEPEFDALVERGRDVAPLVLDFLGADYVLVHVEHSPEALLRYVEEALPMTLIDTWTGADWTGNPSTIQLYQVTSSEPDEAWKIDLSSDVGALYVAEGWSALAGDGVRLATRPTSVLLLDIPDAGGLLQLKLAGVADAVTLRLNGHTLGQLSPDDEGDVRAVISEGAADSLVDRLEIDWHGEPATIEQLAEGRSLIGPNDAKSVGLQEGVSVGVRSAGEEVGDFARIYVNGVDHAVNERGYNLVALTQGGDVLDTRAFDTNASIETSEVMAAWLRAWPAGTVIAGAVADEASYNLQESAVAALRDLGVTTDLRDHFRWSHAFVGVAGAQQGTALEASDLLRPASVWIGPPLDAPAATGGLEEIVFTPAE